MEIHFELGSIKGLVESTTNYRVELMQLSGESLTCEYLKIANCCGFFFSNQLKVLFEISSVFNLSFGVVTSKDGFAFLCERKHFDELIDYFHNSL